MALFAGWMADRVPIRIIAVGSFLGLAVAMGLALIGRNEFFLFGSGIKLGLSVGADMIATRIFPPPILGGRFWAVSGASCCRLC